MKRILFVIDTLCMGGAQKSLINFLKALDASDMSLQIDLLMFAERGGFLSQLPKYVKVVHAPKEIACMFEPLGSASFWRNACLNGLTGKVRRLLFKQLDSRRLPDLNDVQRLWSVWSRFIPELPGQYDVAVGCLEGTCNYYVIDKVQANRKVLWFHNNYSDHGYYSEYDKRYFGQSSKIVTVSDNCLKSLADTFPSLRSKIRLLENITTAESVVRDSKEYVPDAYTAGCLNLLTVGRLQPQKGYDLLVEAASILKKRGINFVWRCIGEGELRGSIESHILRYGLKSAVLLLGTRSNPYPYMRYCDVFVQTSRYEGKSIVLDEAKALCKPIVVTNYPTAADSICDERTGVLCEISAEGIADAVERLAFDPVKRARFVKNLSLQSGDCGSKVEEYLKVYLG